MIYASFYHAPVNYGQSDLSPIEACGSDSVLILDGRHNRMNHNLHARSVCLARGFLGFSLNRGETFTRSTVIQPMRLI